MDVKHIAQHDMQLFLDGHMRPENHSVVKRHLEQCSTCRHELMRYQQVYTLLKREPALNLSLEFVDGVMSRVTRKERQRQLIGMLQWGGAAIGIIIMGIMAAHYIDLSPLKFFWIEVVLPSLSSFKPLAIQLRELFIQLNMEPQSALMVVIILVSLVLADHLYNRYRERIKAFAKFFPILC